MVSVSITFSDPGPDFNEMHQKWYKIEP